MSDENKGIEMLSRETHEALLHKALTDAASATSADLNTAKDEIAQLKTENDQVKTELAELKVEHERVNGDLDKAQIDLKTATDEVASLKADVEAAAEKASKAELAAKRADQVKNLSLFGDEYIAEKASAWADLAEADWAERVEEWRNLKPATTAGETDTASAMSGTSEGLTKEPATESKPKSARRAALGLSS